MFEKLAKDAENKSVGLMEKVDRFNKAYLKLLVHYVPMLTKASKAMASAEGALLDEVEAHPEMFQAPKSRKLFNWKFGFQKKKGKVEIKDEDKTIKLIKKHLPDLAPQLISTKEVVSKEAVAKLTVQEAKKISVNVVEDGDVAFAKLVDTEAAKIVKQGLKDAQVAA